VDVPVLAALLAPQSETHYQFRNPLPVAVEDLLHVASADGVAVSWGTRRATSSTWAPSVTDGLVNAL